MKTGWILVGILLGVAAAQGQVTITSQDMFSVTGQYYRVYANQSTVDVSAYLGTNGGPQTWNFTNGPQDIIYRTDYVSPSDSGSGGDFPLAKVAERQTNEGTGSATAWLFLEQVSGTGRRVYGYVNPNDDPKEGQFNPPIVDFPDPISYQKTWTNATTFNFSIQDILPAQINYSENSVADAYGTVVLPNLGALPCVRVNILEQYDILVDMDLTGNYQQYETDYIRSFYFLSPGHGIVAEIHSPQSTSGPPSSSFTTAHQFSRMFEFSRALPVQSPAAITDLKLAPAGTSVLLSWGKTANTASYRIEYTGSLGGTNNWQALGTTTSDFFLDSSTSGAAQRFYRVVSLGQ